MGAARRSCGSAIPNILFQMLLRASNAVGYTNYPDNVVRAFIKRSAAAGIDVFRIFDSLNSTDNMQLAIEAVRERHAARSAKPRSATPATSSIRRARSTRSSTTCGWPSELVEMGTHILGIKDMAGLCKPYAAYALVKALRDEVGVPIHFHTHDTSGINAGSVLRAADAGVDIVDARARVDERHDEPAVPQQPRRGAAAHRARHRARSGGARRAQPLLGGRPRALLPVRRGPARRRARTSISTRCRAASTRTCASRRENLGLEDRWPEICRGVRRPSISSSATSSRSRRRARSSATWRCSWSPTT